MRKTKNVRMERRRREAQVKLVFSEWVKFISGKKHVDILPEFGNRIDKGSNTYNMYAVMRENFFFSFRM